jgi:flagellar biosynthesis protein FliR
MVRGAGVVAVSIAALSTSPLAAVPEHLGVMIAAIVSEVLFGLGLGLIPLFLISMVQTGVQLASTSMGLNASGLIDPISNAQVSDLSRILGDLVVIMFLLLDGHLMVISAAAGLSQAMVPGSFFLSELGLKQIIDQAGDIFKYGVLLSAPVLVALLITQFVLGMITRAVPTVNMFIVSFPLTIAIGIGIFIITIPSYRGFIEERVPAVERGVLSLVADTKTPSPPNSR